MAFDFESDDVVDVLDRAQHALAAVALGVAVAQLVRFVFAGRSAGRHDGSAEPAALKAGFHLNGRVPARVQNFARGQVGHQRHKRLPWWVRGWSGAEYTKGCPSGSARRRTAGKGTCVAWAARLECARADCQDAGM